MVTRGTGPVLPAVGTGIWGEKRTGVRSPCPPPSTASFLPLMPRCCGPSSVLLHSSGPGGNRTWTAPFSAPPARPGLVWPCYPAPCPASASPVPPSSGEGLGMDSSRS